MSAAQDILHALKEGSSIETAWLLTELGFEVLPVRCTTESNKDKEKIPAYPFSSIDTLTPDDEWEEFEEAFEDPRLGVALTPRIGCGLVIIDADTPSEVKSLAEWWKAHTDRELPPATVATPGVQDESGEWLHEQGGHWYVTYDSSTLSSDVDPYDYAKNKNISWGDDHFNVRLHGSYNILPPSKRSTGSYKVVGDVYDGEELGIAPVLVRELKKERVKRPQIRIERPEAFTSDDGRFQFPVGMSLGERIAVWHNTVHPMDVLFRADGFSKDTSTTCSHNCESVHYDGSAHDRSAVVHGNGCSRAAQGTMTIFSGTLADELGVEPQSVVSMWTVAKKLIYNDDLDACIRGEGIHVPPAKSNSIDWYMNKYRRS